MDLNDILYQSLHEDPFKIIWVLHVKLRLHESNRADRLKRWHFRILFGKDQFQPPPGHWVSWICCDFPQYLQADSELLLQIGTPRFRSIISPINSSWNYPIIRHYVLWAIDSIAEPYEPKLNYRDKLPFYIPSFKI